MEKRERAILSESFALPLICRFYDQFLKGIQKNNEFIEFSKKDLSFLEKDRFDDEWKKIVEEAEEISLSDLSSMPANSSKSFKIYYEFCFFCCVDF